MNEIEELKNTDEWELYEKGRQFNRGRNLYNKTEKNIDFYIGNQWTGAKLGDMQPLMYPVVAPIVDHKTGNLFNNSYEIIYNSNNYESIQERSMIEALLKLFNKHTATMWEKTKMDKKVRENITDSAVTGEGIIYFYYKGEDKPLDDALTGIEAEIVDNVNIYYGDENNSNIQEQPYIIIVFRKSLTEVIEEAREEEVSEEEIKNIRPDTDRHEQLGEDSKYEVDDKVTVLLKMYKKNGTVWFKKTTKTVVIVKDNDTGMKRYPVAHFNWKNKKGYARGLSEVETLIPNQIEINKTLMRRAITVKMMAYPKLVVNIDKVRNPKAIDKVGARIELTGAGVDNVNSYVNYLNPTMMSSDATALQNEMITLTRDLANAGDNATGNVNIEQTSGRALLAAQQAQQISLVQQLNRFKDYLEDIGLILFDIYLAYYTDGIEVLVEDKDNETREDILVPVTITQELLKKMNPYIKIDITPKSAYDRYAQEQSWENLLVNGQINFEEYVDGLEEDSSMNKKKLDKVIQNRKEKERRIQEIENNMMAQKNELEKQMMTDRMANQVDMDNSMNKIENDTALKAEQILNSIGNSGGDTEDEMSELQTG